MTTRLTRWLNTLDSFEEKMSLLPAVRRYGRLTRATGLVLEATGLQLPLGATCVIERQDGNETQEVESEVVGFNGQRLFLMPLEEVEGVLPARAYTRRTLPEKVCKAGSNYRLALLCWVVCWTVAANRSTVCPPRIPPKPGR